MTNHYDRCRLCKHVFKPKKLTWKNVYDREVCLCLCHWTGDDDHGMGISIEDAYLMVSFALPVRSKIKKEK